MFSRARILSFWVLVFLSSFVMAQRTVYVLEGVDFTLLRIPMIVLFVSCFAWICVPFWTAVAGMIVLVFKLNPFSLERHEPLLPPVKALTKRTAIVMPVYHEMPERVCAGLKAMYDAVQKLPQAQLFDFFVLSDSRNPVLGAREEQLCEMLRNEGCERLYYRRREKNTGRKVGNIENFVCNWGGQYEYMLVLDADSVMESASINELACLMEGNDQAAIIQSCPRVIFAETLFSRLVQFTARLYGPLFSFGIAFWHGSSGNYWGHNAIIRLKAFCAHCGLGILPGKPPLGGEILSHDFVEAALLRAAGWGIYLEPRITGSYEEIPPTPIEFLQRDKRWSQGNIQHLKLLFRPRLMISSRTYFVLGALAYVSSPLWLLLLLFSTVNAIFESIIPHQYYSQAHQLFPSWPISRQQDAVMLFCLTMLVLFLPKLGALFISIKDKSISNSFGGTTAMLWSVLIEVIFFTLFAPMMMLFHSRFVFITAIGRIVPWNPQTRTAHGVSLLGSFRETWWVCLLASAWISILYILAPNHLAWMSPVLFGMLLAPVLIWISSSLWLGEVAKKHGLFITPEESNASELLNSLVQQQERFVAIPQQPATKEKPLVPPTAPAEIIKNPIFV